MKKKSVLIYFNCLIAVIFAAFYLLNERDLSQLKNDYQHLSENLDTLVAMYTDSTKDIKRFFSGKEINNYAELIENDSVRNFVLTQSGQWAFFVDYQYSLRDHANTFQLEIAKRERYVKIVGLLFVVVVLANISWLSFSRDRRM